MLTAFCRGTESGSVSARGWLVMVMVLLAGCAANERSLYTGGEVFEGEFEIGRHRVPLPEGEWHFVAYQVYRNREGDPFADVQLLQVDEAQQVLSRGILISANLDRVAEMRSSKAGFCDSAAVYHKSVIRNEQGDDQDCWVLSYFRSTIGPRTDKVSAQTLAYLHAKRIRYPHFAVYTAYRLVSDSDSLTVQYYFNPEYHARISEAPRVGWKDSPWHMDVYQADPMKSAYIEQMKQWSGDWYERVKLGFALN